MREVRWLGRWWRFWGRGGGAVGWNGQTLSGDRPFCGALQNFSSLPEVLGRFTVPAGANIALVDLGNASGFPPLRFDVAGENRNAFPKTFQISPPLTADLPSLCRCIGARGVFDLVCFVWEASHRDPEIRGPLARDVLGVLQEMPEATWVFLGTGSVGWRDPVLKQLRYAGTRLTLSKKTCA